MAPTASEQKNTYSEPQYKGKTLMATLNITLGIAKRRKKRRNEEAPKRKIEF